MKRQYLFSVAAAMLLPAVSQAQVVLTSFEPTEGFTVGSGVNTAGWTLDSSIITNARSFNGANSLLIPRGGGIPRKTLTGVFYNHVSWQAQAEGFESEAQVAHWQVFYAAGVSEARVELKLSYGAGLDDPLKFSFISTYSGGPTQFTDFYVNDITGNNLVNGWSEVAFTFDFSKSEYKIEFGGATIAYASLVTSPTAERITQIYFRGSPSTAVGANINNYVDYIQVDNVAIPEPSVVWLALCPVVWKVLQRRRNEAR